MANQTAYLAEIQRLLVRHFDAEDLRTLCFKLGVDYDSLPAQGKENKARELALHLERRNRLDELQIAVAIERPDIAWPQPPASAPSSNLSKNHAPTTA